MKSVLFFYLSVACVVCNAQKLTMDRYLKESSEFMSDAYGRPLYIKAVYNVEGTPFFQDFYAPARVTLRGISYTNIPVKINLSENTVLYDNNGTPPLLTLYDFLFLKFLSY